MKITDIADPGLKPLFEPFSLTSRLELPNRILLAPCTRNRATEDLSPTPGAVDHYASRASAGLLITEATLITAQTQGYLDTPGIFLDSHERAWAKVADGVHEAGGRIFLQLWHTGRMAHSHYAKTEPRSASAVFDPAKRRQTGNLQLYNEPPLAMTETEIGEAIANYARAASRAASAGFDGIEIHGANGYLPEQFWRQHTNRRNDEWGGTAKKRARFTLEAVGACADAIGADRVGIRLSPAAYFSNMAYTDGDNESLEIILGSLGGYGIAYVHSGIVEDEPFDYLGGTSSEYLRAKWTGTLIGNGAYTPIAAAKGIANGTFDLAAFGKLFLANPRLPEQIAAGEELQTYSRELLKDFR